MNDDGTFKDVELGGRLRHGKDMFDYLDAEIKRIYYKEPAERTESELDLMWYLWCGPDSPFFGKDKMTTFERVEIDDSKTHKEKRNAYYCYQDTETMAINIMHEFGIENTEHSVIVNGHIPVEKINGENPIKANGKLIVIDGGFSKYYQKTTGIAGYTLTYDSRGLYIVAHEPFVSLEKAIEDNADIKATIEVRDILATKGQMTVRDTDKGMELEDEIHNLEMLVQAYRYSLIKENHDYRLIKPEAIVPIQDLKVRFLGGKNPRLHTDEVLIALTFAGMTDLKAKLSLEQLPKLKGCQVHTTVMLSDVDKNMFRRIGIELTSDPVLTKKRFH